MTNVFDFIQAKDPRNSNPLFNFLNGGQQRRQNLNALFDNIGGTLSQFLSPRGRDQVKSIENLHNMFSPIVASGNSIQNMQQGNYGSAFMDVAGFAIPTAIVAKYGGKTAVDAAKYLSETLALSSGGMKNIGENVYESVIGRLNQPGEMPVVGSNLGNVPPQNKNSKTIQMPDGTTIPRPKTMAEVPEIRNMSVADALFVAAQEPHIIKSGDGSRGSFIGGPEKITSKQSLNKQRDFMDAEIDAGAAGGDWYDRYRQGVESVTNNPNDQTWMSKSQGMYSAGVAPNNELGFALKDTMSSVATGTPTKSYTPAQQQASQLAIDTNNPDNYMLGKKTGEYARLINPQAGATKQATGVNDFRHLRTLGFTETDGSAQRNAVGSAGHTYADYETALAVDRANKRNLDGRTDWTGEQIQAAPWVKQKADDIYGRRQKYYLGKAEEKLTDTGSNFGPGELEDTAYSLAFADANKTITEFFPDNTAFATYEAQPFIGSGQLPGLASANQAERAAFANMPESTFANTSGRDDIYANTRLNDTGVAVRTQPTTAMQGVYTPPGGVTEFNPGEVARPLVAFDLIPGQGKQVTDASRAILDAGEATRAFIDVQGAGAWHKPYIGGPSTKSNSIFAALDAPRSLSEPELGLLSKIGKKYDLPDVIDTGQGATLTNFDGEPSLSSKQAKGIFNELKNTKLFKSQDRAKVDAGYLGFEDAWKAGEGSGEATRNLLQVLDNVPDGVYKAFNNNEKIAENALRRLQRDEKLSAQYGATRKDIANARKIIGEGKGWIDRLKKSLEAGIILPGVAAFALNQSMNPRSSDE